MKQFSELQKDRIMIQESSTKGTKGFWAIFGSFFHSTNNTKESDDPVRKAYREAAKNKKANLKKRMEDLKKAKQNALAANITAKFNLKDRQAELQNQRRINAYKALEIQQKALGEMYKSTTSIMTKDEMLSREKQMDGAYTALDSSQGGLDAVTKARNYAAMYQGAISSLDESKRKELENASPEERKKLINNAIDSKYGDNTSKNIESFCNEHSAEIKDAGEDPDIINSVANEYMETTLKYRTLDANQKLNDDAKKEIEERGKAVAKFNEGYANISADDTRITETENKIKQAKADSESLDQFYKNKLFGGKKDELISDDDVIDIIKKEAEKCEDEKSLKAFNEKYGLKINTMLKDGDNKEFTKAIQTDIETALRKNGKPDAEALKSLKENIINKKKESQKNIDKLNGELEQQKNERQTHLTELNGSMSDEEKKVLWGDNVSDLDLSKYSPEQLGECIQMAKDWDPNGKNNEYTRAKSEIDKKQAELDNISADKKSQETRIKEAADRAAKANSVDDALDSDMKEKIEAETDNYAPGESMSDGKIGYTDDAGFHPKPPHEKSDELKKYEHDRKKSLLKKKTDKPADNDVVTGIKKTSDGNYEVTTADGKTETMSKEDTTIKMALSNAAVLHQKEIEHMKMTVNDKLKDCITDGQFDDEKLEKLKSENPDMYETILDIKNHPDEYKDSFKDVSLNTKSVEELTDPEKALEKMDQMVAGTLEDKDKKRWEEVKDAAKLNDEEKNKLEELQNKDATELNDEEKNELEELQKKKKDFDDRKKLEGKAGKELSEEEKATYEKLKKEAGDRYNNPDEYDDEEDTENDDISDDDNDIEDTENDPNSKKVIQNPKKIWHKKKNKRTGKSTSRYYNKEGNSISKEEYGQKIQTYREKKKEQQSSKQESLITAWLKHSMLMD